MEAGPKSQPSHTWRRLGLPFLPPLCIAKSEIPAGACVIIALDPFQHCSSLGTVCRNKCPRPLYLQFSSLRGGGNLWTLGSRTFYLFYLFSPVVLGRLAVGFPPARPCVSSCSRCVASSVRGKSTRFLDISHLFTKLCTHRGVLSWGAGEGHSGGIKVRKSVAGV